MSLCMKSHSVTIQMKATEQFFPNKSYGVTIQMTTTKRHFPVVHFIVLQKIAPSVNPTKESSRFVYCTATARGDLSKNSFGRRKSTGMGLFAFLGNGFPRFSGKSSLLEKRH